MKFKTRAFFILLFFLPLTVIAAMGDSIASGSGDKLNFQVGIEAEPSILLGRRAYLRGDNPSGQRASNGFSIAAKAGFTFDNNSKEGILYRGLYQGVGLGVASYFPDNLLGYPVSLFVYQGAPIYSFSNKFHLDYEWQFGAAMGWKYDNSQDRDNRTPISTPVTAHMGLSFKFVYDINPLWAISAGLVATHYSNGNTSWPNGGLNKGGLTLGFVYKPGQQNNKRITDKFLEEKADKGRWLYDIMVYGAWRKQTVIVGDPETEYVIPGKFPVAGFQFATLRKLNRWCAVGPSLDMKWDQSTGLQPYWAEDTYDEEIKFYQPPFMKQVSIGIGAQAELTMPIFTINVGLGYDVVNPVGEKPFYQSLTLKTFFTSKIYLNVGYRLGGFKDPQNLMLGFGLRM